MKKIIVILILFCLSSLLYRAEAIDKDFQDFFINFQTDLKKYNSRWDSTFISYIDYKYHFFKNYHGNEFKNFLNSFEVFVNVINNKKNEICSLEPQNIYSTRNASDSIRWKLVREGRYYMGFYGDRSYSGSPIYKLLGIKALEDSESYTNLCISFIDEYDPFSRLRSSSCELSSECIKTCVFRPSKGTILTKKDVDNIIKNNNLEEGVKCIIDTSVTEIVDSAFYNRKVTEIIFPKSLEVLGKCAFEKCYNLKSIIFPSSSNLKTIGNSCFSETLIKKIIFPESLEVLGKCVFEKCSNLESIIFPRNSKLKFIDSCCFVGTTIREVNFPVSLEVLGERVFYKCSSLESIIFPDNSKLISIKALCFAYLPIRKVVFPASLKELGSNAFRKCERLESIIFPSNSKLKKIEDACFLVTSIKEVVFPATLEAIGSDAFSDCYSLESITFPANSKLKTIDNGAFIACHHINKLIFPESLEEIGADVFRDCYSLESIIFPNNSKLKKIGFGAFAETGIKKIDFPESLEEIGVASFYKCKLETVTFPSNSKLIYIGNEAFMYNNIKKLIIPDFVNYIGSKVFEHCKKLEIVTFPVNSNLEYVNDFLFWEDSLLTEIKFPKNIKSVGSYIAGFDSDWTPPKLQNVIFQSLEPPKISETFLVLRGYFRFNKVLTIKVPRGSKVKYKTFLDVIIQQQVMKYFRNDLKRVIYSNKDASVFSNLIKIVEY